MERSYTTFADPRPTLSSVLVIGYGNELRRDDGLGPRIASAIESRQFPGVEVMIRQQLTPELAEPISRAGVVVFIDAAVGDLKDVQVRPLTPTEQHQIRVHSSDPSVLLGMAQSVFGICPPAWWITVLASDLDFGEGLSVRGHANMNAALDAFEQLHARVARP